MSKKLIWIILVLVLALAGSLYYSWRQESSLLAPLAKYLPKPSFKLPQTCAQADVDKIMARMAEIEQSKSTYTPTTRDLPDQSTEGGNETIYRGGADAYLVQQNYFGEGGRSELLFYLQDQKPFYIVRRSYVYTAPGSGQVASSYAEKFYLAHGEELCTYYYNQRPREATEDNRGTLRSALNGLQL
jgi:hypothetical protein